MNRWCLLIYALLVLPSSALTQEYSYRHYDITDGLAGSTVYCITQDKDGFIWVGTETGVSRFDGTHFRTFTAADGLPDVEILLMFCDSRGRVWMAPFRKSICYYYKGKIYNQDNDSVLRAIHFTENIENFAEDKDGTLLIEESTRLHLLTAKGQLTELDSIEGRPILQCHAISGNHTGGFLVEEGNHIYTLRNGRFIELFSVSQFKRDSSSLYWDISPDLLVWRTLKDQGRILSLSTGKTKNIPFSYVHYRHVSYSIVDDSIVCSNESVGTTQYTLHSEKVNTFLPGAEVSRTFMDDEGNCWFTTIGRGLYRLNSREVRNFTFRQEPYDQCAVASIRRIGDQLLLGTNRNSVFRIHLPDMKEMGETRINTEEKKRILFLDTLSKGRMVYGADYTLSIYGKRPADFRSVSCNVKAAMKMPDGRLIVATGKAVFIVDLDRFRNVDTLWRERATAVYYKRDSVYIGTLNGLYLVTGDHQTRWLGKEIPFLRKRVSAIAESDDGTIWVASYNDGGVIGIRNGQTVRTIGPEQGLVSDICRTMAIRGQDLWIGTDKGLFLVDITRDKPIRQYTANDGLGSNVINTILVDSNMVYVGTPSGLSFFDKTRMGYHSGCRLSWLDISSSGHSRIKDSAELRLSYKDNNIHVEYAGISYASAGQIAYEYRLWGLDTAWKSTHETFLDYPSLPSGQYELQIIAINKFNSRSRPISLLFEIGTPFWRTAWFLLVIGVVLIVLTWLGVTTRIRRIRNRQEEEKALVRKMNETEHRALQAQMNPHFIFNSLNSIQQYIFNQDILGTNKYIAGLSRLIRATLHNSSHSFISLASEISYLSTYLSLEKARFKDKMDYSITVAPDIDPESIMIPPMMIQPYVENSMRHGLRHKTNGNGYIWLKMEKKENALFIEIEDNGIGREMAARFKTSEHIEYQSRGMSLTAERIGLMNTLYGGGIAVNVVDLFDDTGKPLGTRVIMHFPLFLNSKKKDLYDSNRLS